MKNERCLDTTGSSQRHFVLGRDRSQDYTKHLFQVSLTFAYDGNGQLLGKTDPGTLVQAYTYDAVGQQLTLKDPDSGIRTFSYDALGRKSVFRDPDNNFSTFQYDADSRETTTAYNSGTTRIRSYDAIGRTTKLQDTNAANANLQLLTYTFDSVGNPTQILDSSGDLVQYGYDAKYRLTSANFAPVSNKFYTYTYDAVDNRTFASEDGPSTFTYNPVGQVLAGNALGVLSTYTFDSDGNNSVVQTGANFVTMSYDQENRMTIHSSGSVLNSFTYQPDGMKRTEQVGATTTTLVWDGPDYLQGRN